MSGSFIWRTVSSRIALFHTNIRTVWCTTTPELVSNCFRSEVVAKNLSKVLTARAFGRISVVLRFAWPNQLVGFVLLNQLIWYIDCSQSNTRCYVKHSERHMHCSLNAQIDGYESDGGPIVVVFAAHGGYMAGFVALDAVASTLSPTSLEHHGSEVSGLIITDNQTDSRMIFWHIRRISDF